MAEGRRKRVIGAVGHWLIGELGIGNLEFGGNGQCSMLNFQGSMFRVQGSVKGKNNPLGRGSKKCYVRR